MVKPLLDTNILIDFLGGHSPAKAELALYPEAAISIVTWIEVLSGTVPAKESATRRFLQTFEVIALTEQVAERAVALRRTHRLKLPDAVIWASADTHGLLLVTRDERDFPKGAPGVRLPYRL